MTVIVIQNGKNRVGSDVITLAARNLRTLDLTYSLHMRVRCSGVPSQVTSAQISLLYRASTIGNEICSSQAILQTIEVVRDRELSDGEMQTRAEEWMLAL